jgi:hypothetical protein
MESATHRYSAPPMALLLTDLLLAAKPWTYWLAPVLTLLSVLGLIGAMLNYLVKVVAAKYPKT